MVLKATYFGANGWLLDFGCARVLLDPWLNGDLTFEPGEWLIKGIRPKIKNLPTNIDVILLTQGLPDHAHIPTLKIMDKKIPVVASPNGSKVAISTGFKTVISLSPKESTIFKELEIIATRGAMVPFEENGYIIKGQKDSLYVEPHGFLDESIKPEKIDTLITPVVDISLPIFGDFIKGKKITEKLLQKFKPKRILASTTGGDIEFSGVLSNFFVQELSVEEAFISLGNRVRCINPIVEQEYVFY